MFITDVVCKLPLNYFLFFMIIKIDADFDDDKIIMNNNINKQYLCEI